MILASFRTSYTKGVNTTIKNKAPKTERINTSFIQKKYPEAAVVLRDFIKRLLFF